MNIVKNSEILKKLKELAPEGEYALLLDTVDKYVVLKFNGEILKNHPEDLDFTYFNDPVNWKQGNLFNGVKQINFHRVSPEALAVGVNEILSEDAVEDTYLLLGEVEKSAEGWSLLDEYRLKPYWVPTELEKGARVVLKAKIDTNYDDMGNAFATARVFSGFDTLKGDGNE